MRVWIVHDPDLVVGLVLDGALGPTGFDCGDCDALDSVMVRGVPLLDGAEMTPQTLARLNAIEIEIHVLQNLDLMDSLVGQLYPAMLRNENALLRERWTVLTGKLCHF